MSINKKVLNEELNRFNSLLEYNYIAEIEDDSYNEMDDVVLSEVPGDEPTPNDSDEKKDEKKDDEEEEGFEDKPIDLDNLEGEDDLGDEEGFGDEELGGDSFGNEDLGGAEPEEDSVEIDITDLVNDTEEAKSIANSANQKMDSLMQKFTELQGSLTKMDGISKQISAMEVDLDKRMPSEEEKLEMRSLDSFPYSQKLTDYWSEKEGKYDVMGTDKDEEFVLTQDDVSNDLNNNTVKDSFNDYEEEDFIS